MTIMIGLIKIIWHWLAVTYPPIKENLILISVPWSKMDKCLVCSNICFVHRVVNTVTKKIFFICDDCANDMVIVGTARYK